jgi:hypothetical protein
VQGVADKRAKAAAAAPPPPPAPAAKAKAAKKKAKPSPTPLDEVLAGHGALKKRAGGFFTLSWELVEALSDSGFIWGATFSKNVDLHHFELAP